MTNTLALVPENTLHSTSLLQFYHPQMNFFASPSRVLLAKPPFAALLRAGCHELLQQVTESLQFASDLGCENAIVIGAIPFDSEREPQLKVCTHYLSHYRSRNEELAIGTDRRGYQPESVSELPPKPAFLGAVNKALQQFADTNLQKVVLSRCLDLRLDKAPDTRAIVQNLAFSNQRGFTFAMDLEAPQRRGKTLVGASPELLISRRGNRITANPLAGTEPRSPDPEIDRQRAEQLLRSPKDLHEHALVIKAIREVLTPFCSSLEIPEKPSLMQTETLWHLSTEIYGTLKDPQITSLELALAMHPTPAVCGYPPNLAKQAIFDIEPHDRDLFTGMVGWCDQSGDGEWVVTIRCAEIEDRQIRLYAGAGIVPGSDAEKEYAETRAKFNTILNALNLTLPVHSEKGTECGDL